MGWGEGANERAPDQARKQVYIRHRTVYKVGGGVELVVARNAMEGDWV